MCAEPPITISTTAARTRERKCTFERATRDDSNGSRIVAIGYETGEIEAMQGVPKPERLKGKSKAPDDVTSKRMATVEKLDERHYRDNLIEYLTTMNGRELGKLQ